MRILLAGLMLGVLGQSALACDGQVGDVVFEDTFADNMGGWTFDEALQFTAPGAQLVMPPHDKDSTYSEQNQTFFAREADYCVEMSFPKNPTSAGDPGIGLEFLGTDYDNYFLVEVYYSGKIELDSRIGGKWSTVWTVYNKPVIRPGATDVNDIRAVIKGNLITAYVNGTMIRGVRAALPSGDLKFGFYGEYTIGVKDPVTFGVKAVEVTKGQ